MKIIPIAHSQQIQCDNMFGRLFQEQKRKLFHTSVYESEVQLKKLYIQTCRRLPAYGCKVYQVKELLRGKTKKKVCLLTDESLDVPKKYGCSVFLNVFVNKLDIALHQVCLRYPTQIEPLIIEPQVLYVIFPVHRITTKCCNSLGEGTMLLQLSVSRHFSFKFSGVQKVSKERIWSDPLDKRKRVSLI